MRILAAVLLCAVTVSAQESADYTFNARLGPSIGGSRTVAHVAIMTRGDVFTASTELGAGEDATITAERGGRMYRITLRRPSADADGTADFEVMVNRAVVARTTRPLQRHGDATIVRREIDPNFPPVGGDIKAPVVIQRVEPIYPEEARKARISGIVIVEARIDEHGNVVGASVLKPLPFGLDLAALEALKHWKFRPGTKDGKPVPVSFNLTINFKLHDPTLPTHNQP